MVSCLSPSAVGTVIQRYVVQLRVWHNSENSANAIVLVLVQAAITFVPGKVLLFSGMLNLANEVTDAFGPDG
jgi:hypothetical protein